MYPNYQIVKSLDNQIIKSLSPEANNTFGANETTAGIVAILIADLLFCLRRRWRNKRNECMVKKSAPRLSVRFTDLQNKTFEADLKKNKNNPSVAPTK